MVMMSVRAEPEQFELEGGTACLDFVNTLDGRLEERSSDRLTSYADLLAFALATGNLSHAESETLLAAAARHPGTALDTLRWAIDVREALYRVLRSRLDGDPVDPDDLATLSDAIADAGSHERLAFSDGRFQMEWALADEDGSVHLDRPLWPVARSAALLLTGQTPGTLRDCAADDCAVLFLDTTRNHSRRWCSRSGCGNRERVRQFRQRKRSGA
jgi:predicted RNA-binding Zn ribbon-like protein